MNNTEASNAIRSVFVSRWFSAGVNSAFGYVLLSCTAIILFPIAVAVPSVGGWLFMAVGALSIPGFLIGLSIAGPLWGSGGALLGAIIADLLFWFAVGIVATRLSTDNRRPLSIWLILVIVVDLVGWLLLYLISENLVI